MRLDDWRDPNSPAHLSEGEFATIVQGINAALLGLDGEGRIHLRPRELSQEEKREAEAAVVRRKKHEEEERKRRAEEQRQAKLAQLSDVRKALERAIADLVARKAR